VNGRIGSVNLGDLSRIANRFCQFVGNSVGLLGIHRSERRFLLHAAAAGRCRSPTTGAAPAGRIYSGCPALLGLVLGRWFDHHHAAARRTGQQLADDAGASHQ
jgi:hypothetical protein